MPCKEASQAQDGECMLTNKLIKQLNACVHIDLQVVVLSWCHFDNLAQSSHELSNTKKPPTSLIDALCLFYMACILAMIIDYFGPITEAPIVLTNNNISTLTLMNHNQHVVCAYSSLRSHLTDPPLPQIHYPVREKNPKL